MRLIDAAMERRTESLWCFNLFRKLSSRKLIVAICVLYGLFSVWVLLGVCWFMLAKEDPDCPLHSKSNSDYYFLWLWFCYFWMTVYTCALLVSSIRLSESDLDSSLSQPLLPVSGLSDDSLNTIETTQVEGDMVCVEECTICIEAISAGNLIRKLHCGHAFHQSCIDPWLRRIPFCPNCKRNFH